MTKTEKTIWILIACIVVILISAATTPLGRALWNTHFYAVQKVDDATSYQTRKKVEDTCRSMIASYESDKMTYEQYKESDNTEKQSWAEQAKMRANKTASTYNNFVLENSYVWSGNVPDDISDALEYVE